MHDSYRRQFFKTNKTAKCSFFIYIFSRSLRSLCEINVKNKSGNVSAIKLKLSKLKSSFLQMIHIFTNKHNTQKSTEDQFYFNLAICNA